jgi:chemotaxis protein histidine kinase CheA
MEQARRSPHRDAIDDARRARPRVGGKTGLEGLDNVLRLAFPPEDGADPAAERRGPSERDWVKTLYLVDQAADALRAAEERIRDLEARNEELVRRATDDLKAAQTMVHAAETRAVRAEARAKEAEDRARADRDWLLRIHDAMENLHAPRGRGAAPQGPLRQQPEP